MNISSVEFHKALIHSCEALGVEEFQLGEARLEPDDALAKNQMLPFICGFAAAASSKAGLDGFDEDGFPLGFTRGDSSLLGIVVKPHDSVEEYPPSVALCCLDYVIEKSLSLSHVPGVADLNALANVLGPTVDYGEEPNAG